MEKEMEKEIRLKRVIDECEQYPVAANLAEYVIKEGICISDEALAFLEENRQMDLTNESINLLKQFIKKDAPIGWHVIILELNSEYKDDRKTLKSYLYALTEAWFKNIPLAAAKKIHYMDTPSDFRGYLDSLACVDKKKNWEETLLYATLLLDEETRQFKSKGKGIYERLSECQEENKKLLREAKGYQTKIDLLRANLAEKEKRLATGKNTQSYNDIHFYKSAYLRLNKEHCQCYRKILFLEKKLICSEKNFEMEMNNASQLLNQTVNEKEKLIFEKQKLEMQLQEALERNQQLQLEVEDFTKSSEKETHPIISDDLAQSPESYVENFEEDEMEIPEIEELTTDLKVTVNLLKADSENIEIEGAEKEIEENGKELTEELSANLSQSVLKEEEGVQPCICLDQEQIKENRKAIIGFFMQAKQIFERRFKKKPEAEQFGIIKEKMLLHNYDENRQRIVLKAFKEESIDNLEIYKLVKANSDANALQKRLFGMEGQGI